MDEQTDGWTDMYGMEQMLSQGFIPMDEQTDVWTDMYGMEQMFGWGYGWTSWLCIISYNMLKISYTDQSSYVKTTTVFTPLLVLVNPFTLA